MLHHFEIARTQPTSQQEGDGAAALFVCVRVLVDNLGSHVSCMRVLHLCKHCTVYTGWYEQRAFEERLGCIYRKEEFWEGSQRCLLTCLGMF